jgi:hypothetical protein
MATTTTLDVKVGDQEIFPAAFGGNTYYSTINTVPRMYLGARKVYEVHPNVARWIRYVESVDGQPLGSEGRYAVAALVDDLIAGGFWQYITTCIISCLARTALATNVCLANRFYRTNEQGPGSYYRGFHDILPQYYDRKRGMLFPAGSKAGYTFMPNAPPFMLTGSDGMCNFVTYTNEAPIQGKCSIFRMIAPAYYWNPSSLLNEVQVYLYSPSPPGRGFNYGAGYYSVDPGTATCKTTATQTNKQAQWQIFIDGLPVGAASRSEDSYLAFDRRNLFPMDYGTSTYITYNTDGIANGGVNGPHANDNTEDSRAQIGICIYDPRLWNSGGTDAARTATYTQLHNILDAFIQRVAALP